jgi:hypothetical protein
MTGDTLYAVGGFAGAGLATLEAYDPSTDTWTTRAAMLTARSSIGASAVGGLLYVIGGYDGNAPLATVEAYHP